MTWNVHRPPRADGKRVLVTGGNAGIGYFVAEQLAGAGVEVVLGCRDTARAEAAAGSIRARVPDARVAHVRLDLADPASLESSVDSLGPGRLDAVVQNAGVLVDGPRRETAAGHEMMFGTNHLGHFALTRLLAPLLSATPGSRVVVVGSITADSVRLDLDDLDDGRDFRAKRAYARSKLAQMTFGFELDRRLRTAGSTVSAVVAHPGGALDGLTPARPPVHAPGLGARARSLPARVLLQGKDSAAWPAVRAALDPEVTGGQLWGPRVFGLRGLPVVHRVRAHLVDPMIGERLWAASADLVGGEPVFAPGRQGLDERQEVRDVG
nr:SDR family NAD(P)-dependent oxidoreductase [Actinokineospora enzanensis]